MVPKNDQSASPADDQEDVTNSAAASTASDDNLDSSTGAAGDDTQAEETLHDVVGKALAGDDSDDVETDDTSKDSGGKRSEKSDDEDDPDKEGDSEDEDEDGEKRSGQKEKGEESGEEDETVDENGKPLPFHNHPRFKKVIRQRNELRDEVKAVGEERDQYRQGHEQFGAIQGFMQQNKLQVQDVSQALKIAAAINNDPAKAAEMLQPIVQRLHQYTGEVLPDDLKQRVESGELSEQDARELVKTRNENARLNRQSQQQSQQFEQSRRTEATQRVQAAMADAANREQDQIAKSDPDYEKKAPLVRDKLAVLIPQRQPKSAEEAAALVREAHKAVTKQLSSMVPRREIRPGPSSTESGKSRTAPREPETMQEAIAQAMNKEV